MQNSEAVIAGAAANIYAAYIATNRVPEGDERAWMNRSVEEAIWIATHTDEKVHSDNEIGG